MYSTTSRTLMRVPRMMGSPLQIASSLAKGHPLGAAQIAELYEQLRGEAGPVPVKDAEIALQHNSGIGRFATGSVGCVHILGR